MTDWTDWAIDLARLVWKPTAASRQRLRARTKDMIGSIDMIIGSTTEVPESPSSDSVSSNRSGIVSETQPSDETS